VTDETGGAPAPEPLLTVERADQRGCTVVVVRGEIDLATADRFAAVARQARDEGHGCLLVLDLSAVEFLASAGLGVLDQLAAEADQHGPELRVVIDDNRAVHRPLQVTDMAQRLRLFTSLDAALAR
jgi:anti-sigma B factor antagonist